MDIVMGSATSPSQLTHLSRCALTYLCSFRNHCADSLSSHQMVRDCPDCGYNNKFFPRLTVRHRVFATGSGSFALPSVTCAMASYDMRPRIVGCSRSPFFGNTTPREVSISRASQYPASGFSPII